MSLGSYKPLKETVEFPGADGGFDVRALTLQDIVFLVRRNYETARKLFDRFVVAANQETTTTEIEIDAIASSIFDLAPDLIAEMIAVAADEAERIDLAKMLPTGVQLDATERVFRLTVQSEGGLGKLAETVSRVSQGMTSLQNPTPQET